MNSNEVHTFKTCSLIVCKLMIDNTLQIAYGSGRNHFPLTPLHIYQTKKNLPNKSCRAYLDSFYMIYYFLNELFLGKLINIKLSFK
jgi:hypothetical protein